MIDIPRLNNLPLINYLGLPSSCWYANGKPVSFYHNMHLFCVTLCIRQKRYLRTNFDYNQKKKKVFVLFVFFHIHIFFIVLKGDGVSESSAIFIDTGKNIFCKIFTAFCQNTTIYNITLIFSSCSINKTHSVIFRLEYGQTCATLQTVTQNYYDYV